MLMIAYRPIRNRNSQKTRFEKAENTARSVRDEININGIRCLRETGINEVNFKGRIAQRPFLNVCLQNDLKSDRK
jgi:hypothetical protein